MYRKILLLQVDKFKTELFVIPCIFVICDLSLLIPHLNFYSTVYHYSFYPVIPIFQYVLKIM